MLNMVSPVVETKGKKVCWGRGVRVHFASSGLSSHDPLAGFCICNRFPLPSSAFLSILLMCVCAHFLWDAGNSFLPREKLVLHDASRINFQVFSSGEEAEPVTRGITLSEQLSTAVIVGNIKEQKEGIDLMPTERPRIKGKNLQM